MRFKFFVYICTAIYACSATANSLQYNTFTYIGQPTNSHTRQLTLGGYRRYTPSIGRFEKQDSYAPFQGYILSNGYQYAQGNPILSADKTGHLPDILETARRAFRYITMTLKGEREQFRVNAGGGKLMIGIAERNGFKRRETYGPEGELQEVLRINGHGQLQLQEHHEPDGTIIVTHHLEDGSIVQQLTLPNRPLLVRAREDINISQLDNADTLGTEEIEAGEDVIHHMAAERLHVVRPKEALAWWRQSPENHGICPLGCQAGPDQLKIGQVIDNAVIDAM